LLISEVVWKQILVLFSILMTLRIPFHALQATLTLIP
jgi:hypothetical protein